MRNLRSARRLISAAQKPVIKEEPLDGDTCPELTRLGSEDDNHLFICSEDESDSHTGSEEDDTGVSGTDSESEDGQRGRDGQGRNHALFSTRTFHRYVNYGDYDADDDDLQPLPILFKNWPRGGVLSGIREELVSRASTRAWNDWLKKNPPSGGIDPNDIRDLLLPHPALRRIVGCHFPTTLIPEGYHYHLTAIRSFAIDMFKPLRYQGFQPRIRRLVRTLHGLSVPPTTRKPRCQACRSRALPCLETTDDGPCVNCCLHDIKVCLRQGAAVTRIQVGESIRRGRDKKQTQMAARKHNRSIHQVRDASPHPLNPKGDSTVQGSKDPPESWVSPAFSDDNPPVLKSALQSLRSHMDEDTPHRRKAYGEFVLSTLQAAIDEASDYTDTLEELRQHTTNPKDEPDETRRRRAKFILGVLERELAKSPGSE